MVKTYVLKENTWSIVIKNKWEYSTEAKQKYNF